MGTVINQEKVRRPPRFLPVASSLSLFLLFERLRLEDEEQEIDHLEQKLDKILKSCSLAIDSGKEYVKNMSTFATSLWDLQKHFSDDKSQVFLSIFFLEFLVIFMSLQKTQRPGQGD